MRKKQKKNESNARGSSRLLAARVGSRGRFTGEQETLETAVEWRYRVSDISKSPPPASHRKLIIGWRPKGVVIRY